MRTILGPVGSGLTLLLLSAAACATSGSEARRWYEAGQAAAAEGRAGEAAAHYRRAVEADPSDIEYRIALTLAEEDARRAEPREPYGLPEPSTGLPRRDRLDAIPVQLRFVDASLQEVFERLGELAGVQILFDEAYRDVRVSVDLRGVSVREALELLATTHRLFLKIEP